MHKKKFHFARFFLTYISVAIPVLLVSLLVSNVIMQEMLKMETEILQRQLEDVETAFVKKYQEYYDESVLIASKAELLPQKMLGHPNDIYDGIEILKLKKDFDDGIFSIFLTYENDNIYSSMGVARKNVYFTSAMGCNQESIERGIAAVECDEDVITLSFKNDKEGYILYSFKIYRALEPLTTVNFVIPFEEINTIFTFSYSEQYYELAMKDGSKLVMGTDGSGNIGVIEWDRWIQQTEQEDYIILDGITEDNGVKIKVYCNKMSFPTSKWLYRIQGVNFVLIIMGITLSAAFSWLISHKQMKEIELLESMAKGERKDSLSAQNAYHGLQNLILQGVNKNHKLEEEIFENEIQLKYKLANMILLGVFREPKMLEVAFQEFGFSGIPQRYFVGAVSTLDSLQQEELPELIKKCVWTFISHEDTQIIIFLYEMQTDDVNQLQRKQVAEEIRHQLHRQGMSKVRIGVSDVYMNSILIDCACAEAVRLLDDMVSEKVKDYYLCWDSTFQKKCVVLFDEVLLSRFDDVMQRQNYDEALRIFKNLLYISSSKECTPTNKTYLRYTILQHVVSFLKQDDSSKKAILIEECININVGHEREFANCVINIMNKCMVRNEENSLAKILKYINDNYQRADLTHEEVAVAGGISKSYISKVFRNNYGMSYIEYITRVRLDKACMLLRTTDNNISSIAAMVGYANAATFRRAFKDKYGISASDYRRKENKYMGDFYK